MKFLAVMLWAFTAVAAAQAPATERERHPPTPALESQQEAQALTQDIARLRSLLQQMEMNLAFVTTTQNPLKHQFELEMDMWRVVLDGMERRAQNLAQQAKVIRLCLEPADLVQQSRKAERGWRNPPGTVPLRRDTRQEKP